METPANYDTGDDAPQCCDNAELRREEVQELLSIIEQILYLRYEDAPESCQDAAFRKLEEVFCKCAPYSPVSMAFQRWKFDCEIDPRFILSIPRMRVTLDRMKPKLEEDAKRASEE